MKTIYCVRSKRQNIGNDAVHIGLQHFINQAFCDDVNIVCIPASGVGEGIGLTAKVINEINRNGDGVIIGGGNLIENGELSLDVNALNSLLPPMMLYSISCGKVYDNFYKLKKRTDSTPDYLVKSVCEKARHVLTRDVATDDYLRDLGLKDVRLVGCPTIYLNKQKEKFDFLSEHLKGLSIISVRNPEIMSIPSKDIWTMYNQISKLIAFLKSNGHKKIALLCNDRRDISFAKAFAEKNVDYIYTEDVYKYLAILKYAKINISFRLHASLPQLSFGVPFINISYDERAESLMRTLGLENWNINMMKCDDLIEEVSERYSNLDFINNIPGSICQKWDAFYNDTCKIFDMFATDVARYINGREF